MTLYSRTGGKRRLGGGGLKTNTIMVIISIKLAQLMPAPGDELAAGEASRGRNVKVSSRAVDRAARGAVLRRSLRRVAFPACGGRPGTVRSLVTTRP